MVPIYVLAKIIGCQNHIFVFGGIPREATRDPFFSMHTGQILLDLPCYTSFLALHAGEWLCCQFHTQNALQEIPCQCCFLLANKRMFWRTTFHQRWEWPLVCNSRADLQWDLCSHWRIFLCSFDWISPGASVLESEYWRFLSFTISAVHLNLFNSECLWFMHWGGVGSEYMVFASHLKRIGLTVTVDWFVIHWLLYFQISASDIIAWKDLFWSLLQSCFELM